MMTSEVGVALGTQESKQRAWGGQHMRDGYVLLGALGWLFLFLPQDWAERTPL